MSTKKEEIETKEAETKEETSIRTKEISRDIDNGVVIYKTSAEDGTHFTLLIDEQSIKGTAKDGQVWFYAGAPLGQSPNVRLKE